ncbi:uncharacterized protein LOC116120537 [Pistacia vera]|uniref:uncharacterized protein LOC116120537 n=1 Tax=Pistacia vera TaxID=55513 RepID=UPI001262AD4E|nr:uncharacterized protein LOC116120537 [Pistacia vera]
MENIIKSAIGKKTEGLDIDQLKECLRKEIINGKKYFLVLDDIWNENSIMWDKLKTLLMDGERGSKILVTTRSEQVARITSTLNSYVYPLKVLDENKSWSLFTQIAFVDGIKPKDSKLVEFGKEIVAKCGGVPLVIMIVGHLLHGINEEDDWLHFKDNEMSKVIEKESDILPILKLSYDYLPSHLKQCLASCALFPKDYKIKKQKLIYLWMAQGFLQALDKNECLEEVGNKYFTTLLLMSFFQDPKYDEWDNVVACKMHDLLHELAKLVARTECTFTTIGTVQSVDDKCRHVSLDCGDVKSSWKFPIALYSAKNIRSLLYFIDQIGDLTWMVVMKFFQVIGTEVQRTEPETYEEAMNSRERNNWKAAMEAKMKSLEEVITAKEPPRYKAGLVAKGLTQREGIDFNEVFSLVVKYKTKRLMLSIVAHQDLELEQFDVTTTFLHGDLEEEIYMSQPVGFIDQKAPNKYCKRTTSLELAGFVDLDFASDRDTRKSTTAYYFTLGGNCINWKSQLQPIVALSSTEAEYVAVVDVFKEAIWLKGILSEANLTDQNPTIFSDSQSTIHLSKNSVYHEWTKHIDVRYHFVKDLVTREEIALNKVPIEHNPANMGMKIVTLAKFKHCLDLLFIK